MGNLIVGLVLAVVVFFAARHVYRQARKGQCIGCSGCKGGSDCHCGK